MAKEVKLRHLTALDLMVACDWLEESGFVPAQDVTKVEHGKLKYASTAQVEALKSRLPHFTVEKWTYAGRGWPLKDAVMFELAAVLKVFSFLSVTNPRKYYQNYRAR